MMLPLATYRPFVDPLPIWVWTWGWPLLLLPLCAAVSVVYKSIKCGNMRLVPREALGIFLWIVLSMIAAAIALAGLVRILD